jgi:hypothetical protein
MSTCLPFRVSVPSICVCRPICSYIRETSLDSVVSGFIYMDLLEIGWDGMDWIDLAQDMD